MEDIPEFTVDVRVARTTEERRPPMPSIRRWVIVTEDNHEEDHEYDSYGKAQAQASEDGCAVIRRTYKYDESELVWTPDGSGTWPPKESKSP